MKRFAYIVSIVLICLIMVAYMLVCLVRNAQVQTAAVRWVAAEVASGLHNDIEVGHVEYRFFNTLHIDSVYFSDRQGDTLAYIGSLDVHLRLWDILHGKVSVKSVTLDEPFVNLHDNNHQFVLQAFSRDEASPLDSLPVSVVVNDVSITRLRARLDTLLLTDAEAHISLDRLDNSGVDATIHSLCGRVVSANATSNRAATLFELCSLSAVLSMNDSVIDMPHLRLRLPHSQLIGEVVHIDREGFRFKLQDTYLCARDIGLFVPQIRRTDGIVGIDADLFGNSDSVVLDGLALSYRGTKMLKGAAIAYQWQDFDSLWLRVECQDLLVKAQLLQDFIADILDHPYQLSPTVFRLGNMHYKGALEGRLRNMILRGSFRTALGSITTNGRAQTTQQFDAFDFQGWVSTRRFRLGQLLANDDLGEVSMRMQADGHLKKGEPLYGQFNGAVQRISYKGYTYRDIVLDGNFEQSSFEGVLRCEDPNLSFSLDGLVDLSEEYPSVNVTLDLQHLRLDSLHLTDKLQDSDLSLQLYVNFSGTELDHINGYVVVDSLLFVNAGDSVPMRQLKILAESDSDDPTLHSLKLQSDYAVGRFSGHFSYTNLGISAKKIAVYYLPHLFSLSERERLSLIPSSTQATFYLYAHDLDRIFAALPVNFSQSGSLTLKGMIDEPAHKVAISGVVPELRIGKEEITDIILSADNRNDCINLRASAHIDLPDTMGIGDANLLLSAMAFRDTLLLTTALSNDAQEAYGGRVTLLGTFSEYAQHPVISVELIPSELFIADRLWHVDASSLTYTVADTALQVEHLRIGNDDRFIYIDGIASRHADDSLMVDMKDINLSTVLGLTALAERSLTAQGAITGRATLYGILSNLQLSANVHLAHAGLNGAYIGEGDVWAAFDNERKAVEIGGVVEENGRRVALVDGLITPLDDHTWSLHIYPDSFNLAFINHWTKKTLSDIQGRGTGHVHVFGRNHLVWVTIETKPHNASFIVPFTGVRYFVNDTIYMDSTAIRFPHHTVHDKEGNIVYLDGAVYHTNFRNFSYHLNMQAQNAIVFEQEKSSKSVYYGKVYGTGDVLLEGDEKRTHLLAHAKAQKGSVFALNLGKKSKAKENSFIKFVDHNGISELSASDIVSVQRPRHVETDLDLYVTVDQGTLIQAQFGGSSDDMLRGRGDGDLRVHLINDDLQMQGKLVLHDGSLNYALGNVVHRDFTISEGSTITWQGGASDMNLDIAAKYHLTASLKDLFGSDLSSLQTNRTSVPVNCVIYLRDNIANPVLSFGIELPQSDETVQSQVRSLINSDDMLMREVLYLLVFNRFFTPEYLRATNSTGLNETYSLLSSTVTGQINSWLSKLTNIVTFGINFRTDGEGADASQEYEAQFSIQPIDGLLINGNVGYRYNDLNNRPVFGDLDIEYIITPDGKLRIKGYTHTVDKYSLRQASMVEGVGIVVKHDF